MGVTSFMNNLIGNFQSTQWVYLDVEILIDRVEGSADAEIVLELDNDVLAYQGFEEGIKEHLKDPINIKVKSFFSWTKNLEMKLSHQKNVSLFLIQGNAIEGRVATSIYKAILRFPYKDQNS